MNKDVKKQLKILFTSGDSKKFVDLLNQNWHNPFKGGLADEKRPKDFDAEQLVKGIKVEFEHVIDIFKAAKIAMDHLTESPEYYIKLESFEKDIDKDKEVNKKSNIIRRPTMFKHFARIHEEFVRFARKWEDLTHDLQVEYLKRHPGSKRRVTAQPPMKSETSGLKIYEPVRSQSHDILNFMRDSIGASANVTPVVRNYLTMREDSHNKYHYFAVLPVDGMYVAANVYGRIGYPPKGVAILTRSSSLSEAKAAADNKMSKKMMKGYKPTTL